MATTFTVCEGMHCESTAKDRGNSESLPPSLMTALNDLLTKAVCGSFYSDF
jgi:hypothetical protein